MRGFPVDKEDLKELIKYIAEHDISEFRLENKEFNVTIKRQYGGSRIVQSEAIMPQPQWTAQENPIQGASLLPEQKAAPPEEPDDEDDSIHFITSPIVGTFYRSPSPTSEPFMEEGGAVKVGSILCIVEAMKLMNEIPSEVNGTVVKIFAENAQPVEFGEKLMAIRVE